MYWWLNIFLYLFAVIIGSGAIVLAIINFFKKTKEKKREEKRLEEERLLKERIEAENNLKRLVDEMTSKPCAINGFKNCSTECVHFYPGRIYFLEETYFYNAQWHYEKPRCNLWNEGF